MIWANIGRDRAMFSVDPAPGGTWKLADTGGELPFARKLTTGQQFGIQHTLHVRHDQECQSYKRWKLRQR